MKISIENFKSIQSLRSFEIKPFTVISGVNSSGKSSFIQLLLLLKQTIELDSSNFPFYLNGELYQVRNLIDLLYEKNNENNLKIEFEFNQEEIIKVNDETINLLKENIDKSFIQIEFDTSNNQINIKNFEVTLVLHGNDENYYIKFKRTEDNTYGIETNTNIFGDGVWNASYSKIDVTFLSFFPLMYEIHKSSPNNNERLTEKYLAKLDWVKSLIASFLNQISYVGPLREKPKDEYIFSRKHKSVGIKGENVAQILEEFAEEPIEYFKIIENDNGVTYTPKASTLSHVVKYWMCDVFKVAKNIYVERDDDTYKVILVNEFGIKTSIKHVGFGISQLLPIVVEGLRLPSNKVLILEQPEIHLHPKVQSLLYDFLFGLTLQGKTIIVETHSSHLITRMRRRVAEDSNNQIRESLGLTFIEDNIFRSIELDNFGALNYFPENFIEQSDRELRAIVKAQMNKRITNG